MIVILKNTKRPRFPPVALAHESGLLAFGGLLTREWLLEAYRRGIFPWYSDDGPIMWWSPDPRCILCLDDLKISQSMRRILKKKDFEVTFDRNFEGVMRACREVDGRAEDGTWITEEMIEAYCDLHRGGYAHSVEVWRSGKLAGGLYGVSIGRFFSGESMFSFASNASKIALAYLVERLKGWGFTFIDSQVPSDHLKSLGAKEIPRRQYLRELAAALDHDTILGNWGGAVFFK